MPRLRTTLLVLALLLALAGGPVAAADARIVPGVSIAGARLGDTSAEIAARFGEDVQRLGADDGRPLFVVPFARIRGYAYFALPAACGDDADEAPAEGACDVDGPATYILTRSKAQRTALHLGPGVTERTARRRLRGERCSIAYDTDIARDARFCTVQAPGGKAQTEYEFSRGRMISVGILTRG